MSFKLTVDPSMGKFKPECLILLCFKFDVPRWWNVFDRVGESLTGFITELGEYYLMKPSQKFSPLMKNLTEKNFLAMCVIDSPRVAGCSPQYGKF